MKKWMKNKLLTIVTVIAVAGVGTGALLNASKLESLFNPGKFKKFENRYHSDNYDYAAGDGDDMNLADEDKEGKGKEEEQQQVLPVSEPEEERGQSNLGIANGKNTSNKKTKKNGVEFTDSKNASSDKRGQSGTNTSGGDNSTDTNTPSQNTSSSKETNKNISDTSTENRSDNTASKDDTDQNNKNDNTSDGNNNNKGNDTTSSDKNDTNKDDDTTSWESEQLKPKDPTETVDGKLTLLSVKMNKSEYAKGDTFSAEDADVTATFEKSGKKNTKTLTYGGKDGYSVALSTRRTGEQTAVFSYKGTTTRAAYRVLNNYVNLYYAAADGNTSDCYISAFPGTPLQSIDENGYNTLKTQYSYPNTYVVSGNIFNLEQAHKTIIAHLGDEKVKTAFQEFEGQNYNTTVFLSEDEDGYLTTMLEGFRYVLNKKLLDSRSYIYYPLTSEWDTSGRNIVDVMVDVPEGYKIRRVVQNENNLESYSGDQVLEGYTGSDTTLTVPMGVTKVSLKTKAEQVTNLEIPQSVTSIDGKSIADNLPNLTEYVSADSEKELALAGYKIIDGVVYSADGKTLISVPAGKQQVNVPESVTSLSENCFAGMSSDSLIVFESEKVPALKGETGYTGRIQVPSSDYDVVYKRYMFAFGKEANSITFEDTKGQSNLYVYQNSDSTLRYKNNRTRLAGVAPDTAGEYTISNGITSIGSGAFIDCKKLTDIIMPSSVTTLSDNSLLLPDNVETVTLKADKVTISDSLFGDVQSGCSVPDVLIYVGSTVYENYLEEWTNVLDPVYGEGTAKKLLYGEGVNYLYEDGVKYQKLSSDNGETYRLVAIYQKDQTAVKIKENTVAVSAKAFASCDSLEILYLPQSLTELSDNVFAECTALETIVCANSKTLINADTGVTDSVDIYHVGKEYAAIEYENGIIYGKNTSGERTLLNVPTDYGDTLSVKKNTISLGKEALKNCSGIEEFILEEAKALKEIGESCFEGSPSLKDFDLRAATSLKTIGAAAFKDCHNLKQLLIPDSITVISKQMCYNDATLENIGADNIVEIKEEAFSGCDALENALFDKVETIGANAFYGCRTLKTVTLPETLTSMGESCFENCTSLEKVTINAALTGISRYCFYGCRVLTDISFGSGTKDIKNTLRVIGVQAFAHCSSLEKIDFASFKHLSEIGERAFANDGALINVKLPSSLEKINDACFESCDSLSILQLNAESVTKIGEKIFGDTVSSYVNVWVKSSVLSDYVTEYKKILDPEYGEGTAERILGAINDKIEYIKGIEFEITEKGRILKYVPEDISGDYTVPKDTIEIADEAFMGRTGLTGITIPEEASLRLGNRCFKDCTGILKIELYGTITDWGEETFMNCTGAEKVLIGRTTEAVTEKIGVRAFKNCTGLKDTEAVELRTAARIWEEECFAGCTNLYTVALSESARNGLEKIGDRAFQGCSSMASLLNSKFSGLKEIGDYAFEDCDTLGQPAIPANVTSIGQGCFMNCDKLKYVSFYGAVEEYPKDCFKNCPNLVRTGGTATAFSALKRIGESAYEGCVSLDSSTTSWYIGRYENLESIGASAFKGCSKLSDTTLAASVTSLGANAFDGCSSIGLLTFQSVKPPTIGTITLSSMNEDFGIRVPDTQDDGDTAYKAYLEALTKILGKEKAYAILDSVSDGAKERYQEDGKEKATESAKESSSEKEKETENAKESSSEKEKETESAKESSSEKEKETENAKESSSEKEKTTEKTTKTSQESDKKTTESSSESEKNVKEGTEKSEGASRDSKEDSKTEETKDTGKKKEAKQKATQETQKSEEKREEE